MDRISRKYLRAIGRRLCCFARTRSTLLAGFEQEVADAFSDSTATMADLVARFGSPGEAARTLQQGVPPEEYMAALRSRRLRRRAAVIFCAAVLVLFGIYILWGSYEHPFYGVTYVIQDD